MSEQAAVADPTPAVEAPVMEANRGPLVNLTPEQRAEYKTTGILPTPKTEEAAPSSDAEPTGEAKPAGDSETPPVQEKPKAEPKKQTAAERIAELKATIAKIEKGAGIKTEAESSPVKPEPKPQPKQQADKEPTAEDLNPDGTLKYNTYEEVTKAIARWEVRQELAAQKQAEWEQAEAKKLDAKMDAARTRYDNLDDVLKPTVAAIVGDEAISPVIKQMLYDSDISADLVFTLGQNEKEFADFVKLAHTNPGKAIRYLALTESLIQQELEGKAESKPVEEPPAKPRTQAPKPPAEAGGRGTTPPDTLQAALEGSGGKLNAGLKAEFLRRDLARLKG